MTTRQRTFLVPITAFVFMVSILIFGNTSPAQGEGTETTSTVTTTQTVVTTETPVATPTPKPDPLIALHKKYCGKTKWKGSHKLWDKITLKTLKKLGLSKREIKMAMSIHHREGGPNSVNKAGRCYGGWQLSWGMAHGHRWWCPEWETRRAVRYMKGRYGSIAHAYYFKNSHGWY